MDYFDEDVCVGPSACGLGVFSLRTFRSLDMVGQIDGVIIKDLAYESNYCMEIGNDWALEPDPPFRFVNHSCHPNCTLVEIEAAAKGGVVELWLQAVSEIGPDEELTIDYGWPARVAVRCLCGCADCRGWIVASDELGDVEPA